MNMGWIKLHRTLLDHPLWQCGSPQQKVILVTLLLMANHAEKHWQWQGKPFTCRPGQMITSAKSIAECAGKEVSRQNVRTTLKRLQQMQFLTLQPTRQHTLITIINWETYQSSENPINQDANQSLTNDSPMPNHRLTTNKNVKNEKNGKKVPPPSFISFEQQELAAIRARNEAALQAFVDAPEDKPR